MDNHVHCTYKYIRVRDIREGVKKLIVAEMSVNGGGQPPILNYIGLFLKEKNMQNFL